MKEISFIFPLYYLSRIEIKNTHLITWEQNTQMHKE